MQIPVEQPAVLKKIPVEKPVILNERLPIDKPAVFKEKLVVKRPNKDQIKISGVYKHVDDPNDTSVGKDH